MITQEDQHEIRVLLAKPDKSWVDTDRLMTLLERQFGVEIFNKALRFIFTILGYPNHDLADDWRQEILFSFVRERKSSKKRAIDQYDPAKSKCADGYSAWVRCIIKSKLIDLQRQLKRDPHYTLTKSGNPESVDDDGIVTDTFSGYKDPDAINPERAVIHQLRENEIGEEIRAAVKQLPPKQKQAFTLTKLEQLSYKDAAAVMEANLNTFKSHVRAANANLCIHLANAYKELNAA